MSVLTRRGISWGWLSLAVVTALVVSFLIFSGSGSCADSTSGDAGSGTCATEPIMGVAGAWVLGVVALIVIVYSIARAFGLVRNPSA